MKNKNVKNPLPFLRWAGGKRWLISNYKNLFPTEYNTYIEPFLGSGRVFFHLSPSKAILSDLNSELITTFKALKNDPSSILTSLKKHAQKHNQEYYYNMRNKNPRCEREIASRFIYLNRTCFNGIYRVNSKGKFNVPFGKKENVILPTDNFFETSSILQNVELLNCDFAKVIDKAKENDFLFVDPPYTVAHNNNGFIQYNEKLFSWEDQIRLSEKLIEAKSRGVLIMLTNANHKEIKKLYENDFNLLEVSRYTSISGQSKNRKSYSELIIMSY